MEWWVDAVKVLRRPLRIRNRCSRATNAQEDAPAGRGWSGGGRVRTRHPTTCASNHSFSECCAASPPAETSCGVRRGNYEFNYRMLACKALAEAAREGASEATQGAHLLCRCSPAQRQALHATETLRKPGRLAMCDTPPTSARGCIWDCTASRARNSTRPRLVSA